MSLPARKKIAVHPGQVLQDMLEELSLSQSALARHLGTDHAKINVICKGKRGITADMAYRLGRACDIDDGESSVTERHATALELLVEAARTVGTTMAQAR